MTHPLMERIIALRKDIELAIYEIENGFPALSKRRLENALTIEYTEYDNEESKEASTETVREGNA